MCSTFCDNTNNSLSDFPSSLDPSKSQAIPLSFPQPYSPKTGQNFNLFREKVPEAAAAAAATASSTSDNNLVGLSPVPKNVSTEDVGYLSDSDSSLKFMKSRMKVFIDSFGKGKGKKKDKKRPTIEVITTSQTLPNLTSSVSVEEKADVNENKKKPFKKMSDSSSELEVNNRHSLVSGCSNNSSTTSNSSRFEEEEEEEGEDRMDIDNLTLEEKQARKVFNIAKEIMTSEQAFVNVLRLINVEFKEFIERGMKASEGTVVVIPEKDFTRLFVNSNLMELQILNADFLKDFAERVANWSSHKKIADIIVKKGAFLKLYTSYVQAFPELTTLLDECCEKYPPFRKLVREFETREQCGGLKIHHFLLKPVQRLPQYKLLLENYHKNLSPGSEDYEDATEALAIVTEAAMHANEQMKQAVRKQL